MPPNFRPLPEHELASLPAPQLLRFVHAARAARDETSAALALQLMMWRHERIVRGMVARKVPVHRVDDAASHCIAAVADAIVKNPPDATSEKHFRGWMAQVVRNQINAWWRKNAKHEEPWSIDASIDGGDAALTRDLSDIDHGYELVDYREIVDRKHAELSEQHRRIVELRIFAGRTSRDVAEVLFAERGESVKPNTIDQIASRFRQDCKADAGLTP